MARESEAFPTLEELFSTDNAAQLIVLNSVGRGHRNPRISLNELVDRYRGIFGKHGLPSKQTDGLSLDDALSGGLVDEYAKPGDSYTMSAIRKDEAGFMARILLSPSMDPEQIRQRQELIGRLATSKRLNNLIQLKDQTWRVFEGLGNFLTTVGNFRFEETSLIEHYYAGTEFVPILEYEYDRNSEILEKRDIMELVGEAVDRINKGLVAFVELSDALATSPDPFIRQTFSGIPNDITKLQQEMAESIPFDKKPAEKGKYSPEGKLRNFENLYRSVEPYFLNLSSILEFAKKIRDEGWKKVSFDPTQPLGYTGGWNIEESKYGQMHNDGPTDRAITILSGPNTSGKSFTMKSDWFIHIAAQSLGFAPVQSANLQPFSNFIYFDRAATDPLNDLSAYMREVENWKLVLQDVGAGTRLYVDESYSTTSPHDQARLLLATANYIQGLGGSVMLATHNDLILDTAEHNQDIGVYNLQTEVNDSGELLRHFKLQAGRSESLSIAVARARQFPPSALNAAERYLQRGLIEPNLSSVIDFPQITPKSPEQRSQEKQLAATLEKLFPEAPLKPLFHRFSLDREITPHSLLRSLEEEEQGETRGIYNSPNLLGLLGEMILWQSAQTPAEVLERQQLFTELIKTGLYEKLPVLTEEIEFLEETVAIIGQYVNVGINKGLNLFQLSDEEIDKIVRDIDTYHETIQIEDILKAIDAYLSIQIKLLGELPAITDLKNRYAILREVNSSTMERWRFNEDTPLTDAEQEKARSVINHNSQKPGQRLTAQELQIATIRMLSSLRDTTNQLPAVGMKDLQVVDIGEELDVLETYLRKGEKRDDQQPRRKGMIGQTLEMLELVRGGLPMAVHRLPEMMDKARSLVKILKSTDSTHLNQAANLIERQLNKHEAILAGQAEETVEDEIQSTIPEETISPFNHLRQEYRSFYFHTEEPKKTPFKTTLNQLEALAMFAQMINHQKLAKVRFNDTGEIHFKNAFSVFKEKNEQVANDIDFSPNTTRVQLLTGPNGSGKTFYEKGAVAGVLMALATGYAPAEEVTMPVFDAVTYLDRVVEKQDSSYSSFSQELEYWKALLDTLSTRKAAFAAIDEAFSTTSPGYQAAFTAAVVSEILQGSHSLMLSTHNHDAVESLVSSGISQIKPFHFGFNIEDQRIHYLYRLQKGHQLSHAIEVARTLGLTEEILSAAQA